MRRITLLAIAAAAIGAALPSPAVARKAPSAPLSVGIGAYIPGSDTDPSLIDQFAAEVGREPVIVSFYRNWGPPLVNTEALDGAAARGAVPMLTWEPWDESESAVPLESIANGSEDAYIRESARQLAAWGQPVFLRFAHEMNGNWYPWGWGVAGNTPALYKLAWRHVVTLFREEGASNVRWVWCPYVSNTRLWQFKRFYPGDKWVDWVGIDGFNWGSYRTWQSFDKIFADSYQKLTEVTSRPMMIGEMGVSQSGGNKPHWITESLRRRLPKYRHIRALVWFDDDDRRGDFRVDSSAGALAAFRLALGGPQFASDRRVLLSTPGHLKEGGALRQPRRGSRR